MHTSQTQDSASESPPTRSARVFCWIADRPWFSAIAIVLLTGVSILGQVNPEWVRNSAWYQTLTRESDDEIDQRAVRESRITLRRDRSQPADVPALALAGGDATLVLHGKGFFTPQGSDALREIAASLEALPVVDSLLWIDRLPGLNLFGLSEPLLPRSTASPVRFEAAKQRALDHPLVSGQLMSDDGETLLILATFNWLHVTSDRDVVDGLVETVRDRMKSYPDLQWEVGITGRVPLVVMTAENRDANNFRYQMIGYAVIAISSLVLFRGLSAVFIVALAPALGVFWTMSCLQFTEIRSNPLTTVIVPILVSLVGLTDAVHLMVQIRKRRGEGASSAQAARQGLSEVGLACLLTSVTTAIGFASLTLAHHEVVREFGIACVIGVCMTFVSVITLIPLLCRSPLGRRLHLGIDRSVVDKQLNRIAPAIDWVLAHSRAVAAFAILATLALASVTLLLQPDERRWGVLPDDYMATETLRLIDRELGGLETASVVVRWDQSVHGDGEILGVIDKVDQVLASEDLLGRPVSILDLLNALPGDGPPSERMSLLELMPPSIKRAFYKPEMQSAEVQFRVQDLGIAQYNETFQRIESQLAEIEADHPEFLIDLDGTAVWRWKNIFQIVVDLATSLGVAIVIILLVLAVAYRSLRLGLISVVPNLFPLAATGAMMYAVGLNLEITPVCCFTICLGIAVDDTIHFLTRYREESKRTSDRELAIRRAFTGVGTALIMTTIVLVAGFSTVLFSSSRDHRIFGWMGSMTLVAALFADLFLLPAMLARFDGRKNDEIPAATSENSPTGADDQATLGRETDSGLSFVSSGDTD